MIKININIDPGILKRLKNQAKEEGRNVSEIIRQVVMEYLKKQEKEKK